MRDGMVRGGVGVNRIASGVGLVTIWTKIVPKSSGVGVIRGSKRLEPVPGAVSETRKSE